jgi:hypothetical protein
MSIHGELMECSKCKSKRIVTGSVVDRTGKRCLFAPDGLGVFTMALSYGTKLDSFACLDCGLVWFATSAAELENFVRKHCDQRID